MSKKCGNMYISVVIGHDGAVTGVFMITDKREKA